MYLKDQERTRMLYVLKKEKRDAVLNKIFSVFTTHQNDIEELKRKGVEIVGYARKSPHITFAVSGQ